MRWLIDGYNVIRRDPDLRAHEAESLEAGRRALLHLIAGLARRSSDEFIVVFDGAHRAGAASPVGRVRPIFSRPPESADDVLRRLAAQWREGAVVVTGDRAVQSAAHRAGTPVVPVEDFLAAVAGEPSEDDGDDDVGLRPKGGNPRRRSKDSRAAQRALRRLRSS